MRRACPQFALPIENPPGAGQDALNGIFSITAFEPLDERLWTAVELMDLAEQLEDTIGPWQ